MDIQELTDKVTKGVDALNQKATVIEKKYDDLEKETKKAIEDLTMVKNHQNDFAATLTELRRVQGQVAHERRYSNDPFKRFTENPERKKFINTYFRWLASKQPITNLAKEEQEVIQRVAPWYTGGTPGSTFLQTDIAREVYDLLATYGIWNTFDVIPVGTKTTTIPVATARPVALVIAESTGYASDDTTQDTTSVSLAMKDILCLIAASRDILQDAEIDVTSMIMEQFAQAWAYRLDYFCLAADGTDNTTAGAMTGVFSGGTAASAGTGNTTVAALQLEDFVRCLTTVAAAVLRRPARWWMHPTVLAKIALVRDSNGRSLFQTALEAPSPTAGSILGYPVVLCDAAPSTDSAGSVVAVFGDPKGLAVGIRSNWAFEYSDDYKFNYLNRYFRGWGRAGVIIKGATAFAKLTLAAA